MENQTELTELPEDITYEKGGVSGLESWCMRQAIRRLNECLDPDHPRRFKSIHEYSNLLSESIAVLYARPVAEGELLINVSTDLPIPVGHYVSVSPEGLIFGANPTFWLEQYQRVQLINQ